MPAAVPDDDLFTPTLTEADDAVGFRRPWNPWSLVFVAFFRAAVMPAPWALAGGGGTLALNFARLGVRQRVLPAGALVLAAALVAHWIPVWLGGAGGGPNGASRT